MREFVFTAASITGEITFQFAEHGLLNSFIIEADLSEEQQRWILRHRPQTIEDLEKLKVVAGSKITEIKREITFDMFYNKYGVKENKKRAQNRWNRMSASAKARAFYYVSTYYSKLNTGVQPKYPETYLNAEPWND